MVSASTPTNEEASAAGGAQAAPAGFRTDLGYEVRWDEGQRLFRVWNPMANAWVSAPGFSDERIARVVAEGLSKPPQARRGAGGGDAGGNRRAAS